MCPIQHSPSFRFTMIIMSFYLLRLPISESCNSLPTMLQMFQELVWEAVATVMWITLKPFFSHNCWDYGALTNICRWLNYVNVCWRNFYIVLTIITHVAVLFNNLLFEGSNKTPENCFRFSFGSENALFLTLVSSQLIRKSIAISLRITLTDMCQIQTGCCLLRK